MKSQNHNDLSFLCGKEKSGAGLMALSILLSIIKAGCWCVVIYVTLWCLDHFGILQRILWVAE